MVCADPKEIQRTLRALVEPGAVVELRALEVPDGRRTATSSGYFVDLEACAREAAEISDAGARGVYITLNPVDPALLARSANRARFVKQGDGTSDREILRRRWLPIDCDPERPTGISATAAERERALERGRQITRFLRGKGWQLPFVGDSGNGAHLLYRIDLPAEDGGLVKSCLQALALRFGGDGIKVDTSNSNPARIWKLYGTVARKGDSTPDRPHRLASFTYEPPSIAVVSRELLQELAATAPKPETGVLRGTGKRAGSGFSLDEWITEHHLDVRGPYPWQGGRKWIFNVCPWIAEHTNGSAYLVQFVDGAIAAGCHHDSCRGRVWRDLRELYEPDAHSQRDDRRQRDVAVGNAPHDHASSLGLEFARVGDLLAEPDTDIPWVIDQLLPAGGLSAMVAKPKVGKSTLARCIALAVSRGEPVLGRTTKRGRVLYLALEESRRQVKAHFQALGAGDDDVRIYAARAPVDALLKLRVAVSEHEPVLVVIDTLFRLTRVKDANDYAQVTAALDPLLALARELGTHVMFLHHSPKGDPRQAIDAALGSTAIAGSVDTLIVLRRGDRFRTIITEQREGEGFPEEMILDFDSESRSVTLGTTRQDADDNEAGREILAWLRTQPEPIDEKTIHEAVEGRRATKQRALRRLVDDGLIERTGRGKRNDPYLYAVRASLAAPSPDSSTVVPKFSRVPENQKSREEEKLDGTEVNSGTGDLNPETHSVDECPQAGDLESARLVARFDDLLLWKQ
jgi:hypothetical protein